MRGWKEGLRQHACLTYIHNLWARACASMRPTYVAFRPRQAACVLRTWHSGRGKQHAAYVRGIQVAASSMRPMYVARRQSGRDIRRKRTPAAPKVVGDCVRNGVVKSPQQAHHVGHDEHGVVVP
eukprot:351317-Chlamydomonas_euryale.AAC.8